MQRNSLTDAYGSSVLVVPLFYQSRAGKHFAGSVNTAASLFAACPPDNPPGVSIRAFVRSFLY